MAHSNKYFKMQTRLSPERHISLTARTPEYGEVEEVFDNMIQLCVQGPVYGTPTIGEVGIWLTEQEQDDLIAGILERRGISISWEVRNGGVDTHGYLKARGPISPTGTEQSKIHPVIK